MLVIIYIFQTSKLSSVIWQKVLLPHLFFMCLKQKEKKPEHFRRVMLNLAKESFIFQVMRCSSSLCSLSGSNFMFGYNNLGGSPCSKIHGVLLNLGQHLSYQLESDVEKKYSLLMCISTIDNIYLSTIHQLLTYQLPINYL